MTLKKLTIYIILLVGVLQFSCKQECTYSCDDNADCIKGACECDDEQMYKVLNGTHDNPNNVDCMPPYLFESAYTYRPMEGSSCLCAEDIVLYFYNCFSNGGGLVGPCSAHIMYKDTAINMYRNNTVIMTSIFPVNEGQQDRLVFAEWGDRTGQKAPFCRDKEGLGGVIFRGQASEDLDTIDMNLVYYNPDWFVDRDSCALTFLRVKKEE